MESSEIEVYYDVEYLESILSVYWRDDSQGLPSFEEATDFAHLLSNEKDPYKIRIVKRTYETVLTIE